MSTYFSAEYTLYNDTHRSRLIVRESGDVEGLTDLVYSEPGVSAIRITIADGDLPLLVSALNKRILDVQRPTETELP